MVIKFRCLEEDLSRYKKLSTVAEKIGEEKCNYHLKLIDKLLDKCMADAEIKQSLINQRMSTQNYNITTYMIYRRQLTRRKDQRSLNKLQGDPASDSNFE